MSIFEPRIKPAVPWQVSPVVTPYNGLTDFEQTQSLGLVKHKLNLRFLMTCNMKNQVPEALLDDHPLRQAIIRHRLGRQRTNISRKAAVTHSGKSLSSYPFHSSLVYPIGSISGFAHDFWLITLPRHRRILVGPRIATLY